MRLQPYFLLFAVAFLLFTCHKTTVPKASLGDEELFRKYLELGDSIYATKTGYEAFGKSMIYFDSAMMIAQRTKDTLMLAEGIFAKGRVYDAWNREPQKTVVFFKEAAQLYRKLNQNVVREYYIWHLVAHAYDKMKDSSNCVKTLNEIYDSLKIKPKALREKMEFIPQMAHISVVVKNYDLAERILNDLYLREWIKNNPETYNYEDFYFITKSSIDINKYHKSNSTYIDSLAFALHNIKNPMDSLWYLNELVELNGKIKHFDKAYAYFKTHQGLNDKINSTNGIESMQNKLLNMELQAERKKLEAEQEAQKSRNMIWTILFSALFVISILLFRIWKGSIRDQQKSVRLKELNTLLESKVQEIQLVNKEIQHRIKNNLHLIFSLLNMQERKSDNPDTIENLQKARLRIESIAGLHDQLSKNDHNDVDFNIYINNLIQTIIECVESEQKVITNLDVQLITVPHNYYFSIGLILNEWMTNSIKYAQTNSSLVLNIKIRQSNNEIVLEYFDNGIVANNEQKTIGLGKEIIQLLTKQMRGKIENKNNNPYHYILKITTI